MTATPPRADLRTLATLAAHDVDCPDGPNCHENLTTDGRYGRYADAVLAAVLPEHRRVVAEEIARAIDAFSGDSVCQWTKGEAVATAREYGETDPEGIR